MYNVKIIDEQTGEVLAYIYDIPNTMEGYYQARALLVDFKAETKGWLLSIPFD